MKSLFHWLVLLAMIVLLSCDNTAANASEITAPGQATSGYGSTAIISATASPRAGWGPGMIPGAGPGAGILFRIN